MKQASKDTAPIFSYGKSEKKSTEGTTYRETRDLVREFAAGLLGIGVQKEDRVALIAEGRNDWVISELGILYAGAINVPLSVKLNEQSELKFRLAHSGCRMAIVSATQALKVQQLKNDLPDLERIILLDPAEKYHEDEIPLWQLLETGKRYLTEHPDSLRQSWQSIREATRQISVTHPAQQLTRKGSLSLIGTTLPMSSKPQRSLRIPEHYCSLLILPWDHCFAHTAGIYTLMKNGASMASVQAGKTAVEALKNIPVNIKESKPTFLLSVPTLQKTSGRTSKTASNKRDRSPRNYLKKVSTLRMTITAMAGARGKGLRLLKKPLYMFFDKILFRKIRQNFGGRLEFFIGGGALLDIELQRFFYAIGIPMFQGYGLSESSPVDLSKRSSKAQARVVGKHCPEPEVKICDEKGNALATGQHGEIVVKGENVMAGYWKNEKATRETIRNGWL